MAYGPEISATYRDGTVLTLRRPLATDLLPFFPVDPSLATFAPSQWRRYYASFSPIAFMAKALNDPERPTTSWGVYASRPDMSHEGFAATVSVHDTQGWFHTQILNRHMLRQRIGTRASALAVGAALVLHPDLAEITTYVHRDNEASLRMVRGLGFVQDASYVPKNATSRQLKFEFPRPELPEQNRLLAAVCAVHQTDIVEASFLPEAHM